MNYSAIQVERQGRTAIVRWNRPDRLNAFSPAMLSEWVDALSQLNADAGVGAIVVTGNGRAYSAGSDISGDAGGRSRSDSTVPPFDAEALVASKPIVGAINGVAVGMGFTTTLLFDFNVASTEARFSARFAALGLTPEFLSAWLLPKVVGWHRAKEMVLTGRIYSASEALSLGIVREVVPPDELMEHALAMAEEIAANPTSTLHTIKRLMWEELWTEGYSATKRRSDAYFEQAERTAEHQEALAAFRERRSPRFHDREYMEGLRRTSQGGSMST